jgi:hypothetical protein
MPIFRFGLLMASRGLVCSIHNFCFFPHHCLNVLIYLPSSPGTIFYLSCIFMGLFSFPEFQFYFSHYFCIFIEFLFHILHCLPYFIQFFYYILLEFTLAFVHVLILLIILIIIISNALRFHPLHFLKSLLLWSSLLEEPCCLILSYFLFLHWDLCS